MRDELQIAVAAARRAAEKIRSVREENELGTQYKPDDTPVTRADMLSNEIIVRSLREHFPEDYILSEESQEERAKDRDARVWIIDPLDGTKEFVAGYDEFTVNIALVYKRRPVMGVVYVPLYDELYYAIEGEGAFLEKEGRLERLSVSKKTKDLTVLRSRFREDSRFAHLLASPKVHSIIKMGSARKGCLIAGGEAHLYYSFGPTMEWDVAPVDLIVHEAGGILEELDGKKMYYNRDDHYNRKGFYVCNRRENLILEEDNIGNG